MTISLRDARASREDRSWIAKVFRDYMDDLDPMSTGIFPVLGEVGHREPDQVARWFGDPNAYPLVIAQSQLPVGFAMVARVTAGTADYRMGEFFIARNHRGLGLGRGAVQLILDRFAGRWEINEYQRNPNAVKFWRRVVTTYTAGHFEERTVNGEVRQTFESGPRRR
ncbi:MAG TPA: GNAT family N-acetyltransferase [Steroidobacteraceae bacterium]|nr:GNAT family N-acetyltransferase [Steroidobacteraceae bacterium]